MKNNKGISSALVLTVGIVLVLFVLVLLISILYPSQTSFNNVVKKMASPNDWCDTVVSKLNEQERSKLTNSKYSFELIEDSSKCKTIASGYKDSIDKSFKWDENYYSFASRDTAKTGLLCCIFLMSSDGSKTVVTPPVTKPTTPSTNQPPVIQVQSTNNAASVEVNSMRIYSGPQTTVQNPITGSVELNPEDLVVNVNGAFFVFKKGQMVEGNQAYISSDKSYTSNVFTVNQCSDPCIFLADGSPVLCSGDNCYALYDNDLKNRVLSAVYR